MHSKSSNTRTTYKYQHYWATSAQEAKYLVWDWVSLGRISEETLAGWIEYLISFVQRGLVVEDAGVGTSPSQSPSTVLQQQQAQHQTTKSSVQLLLCLPIIQKVDKTKYNRITKTAIRNMFFPELTENCSAVTRKSMTASRHPPSRSTSSEALVRDYQQQVATLRQEHAKRQALLRAALAEYQ